jgi:hypothetical protein
VFAADGEANPDPHRTANRTHPFGSHLNVGFLRSEGGAVLAARLTEGMDGTQLFAW